MAENIPSEIDEEQARSAARSIGDDPAVLAAVGSVLLSLYIYYVGGHKQQGIFVGLWAPTFLAFADYLRSEDVEDPLERVA